MQTFFSRLWPHDYSFPVDYQDNSRGYRHRCVVRDGDVGAAEAGSAAWPLAARQWERFGLTAWTFGDLPERITISDGPGLPLYAWPGLQFEDGVRALIDGFTPERPFAGS